MTFLLFGMSAARQAVPGLGRHLLASVQARLEIGARVLVFSATASRQLSQESPDWGHGAFTKALIDALTAAKREQRKLTTTDLKGSPSARAASRGPS